MYTNLKPTPAVHLLVSPGFIPSDHGRFVAATCGRRSINSAVMHSPGGTLRSRKRDLLHFPSNCHVPPGASHAERPDDTSGCSWSPIQSKRQAKSSSTLETKRSLGIRVVLNRPYQPRRLPWRRRGAQHHGTLNPFRFLLPRAASLTRARHFQEISIRLNAYALCGATL